MRIIKQGRIRKPETTARLECGECGTIFEADEGEYEIEYGAYKLETIFKARCPFCKAYGVKRRICMREA